MNTKSLSSTFGPGEFRQRNGMKPGDGRLPGALIVAGMHLAVMAGLWNYQPAREALAATMPIMVDLITLTPAEPPREKLKPVAKPVPAPRQPELQPKPQIVAAAVEAPASYAALPPPPEPPKLIAPAVVAAAPVVAPPQLPVIPPRFDASYLDNPAPAYPTLSRRLQEQGRVMLRVLVTAGGTAERIELRSGSGSTRLDGAALETVKRWRFIPAKQGAEAVSAWVLVPISFALEG